MKPKRLDFVLSILQKLQIDLANALYFEIYNANLSSCAFRGWHSPKIVDKSLDDCF